MEHQRSAEWLQEEARFAIIFTYSVSPPSAWVLRHLILNLNMLLDVVKSNMAPRRNAMVAAMFPQRFLLFGAPSER